MSKQSPINRTKIERTKRKGEEYVFKNEKERVTEIQLNLNRQKSVFALGMRNEALQRSLIIVAVKLDGNYHSWLLLQLRDFLSADWPPKVLIVTWLHCDRAERELDENEKKTFPSFLWKNYLLRKISVGMTKYSKI